MSEDIADRNRLRELSKAATPSSEGLNAEWGVGPAYDSGAACPVHDVEVWIDGAGVVPIAEGCVSEDAAFIAAANPAVVLALLDRVEALEGLLSLARGYVVTDREALREMGIDDPEDHRNARDAALTIDIALGRAVKCARTVCKRRGRHEHRDLPGLYCRPCALAINDSAGFELVAIAKKETDALAAAQPTGRGEE